MMKSVVAIAVTSLLCGVVCAQIKPDGERDKLAGAVHTLRTERMTLSDQHGRRQDGPHIPVSLETFDTQGNLTETVSYEQNGSVSRRTVNAFDSAGHKTGSVTYKDKPSSKSVYTLDANGRVAQVDSYDDKGALTAKTFYEYDQAGRRTQQRREENGEPDSTTTYRYDSAGRLFEKTTVSKTGEMSDKTTFVYVPNVTRIEAVSYEDKAVKKKTVRIHNQQKRRTDIGYYVGNDKIAWRWSFTYDERGNVVGEEFANEFELAKWDYAYEYDKQGNWVKRTKSRWYRVGNKLEAIPVEAVFRSLTYYPQPYARKDEPSQAGEEAGSYIAAGGVLQGEAIRRVEPEYPGAARQAHVSGTVLVEVTVDEAGNVIKSRAISGPMILQAVSEAAAKGWKFKPTLLSGMPVKVVGTVTFNFNL